MATELKNFTEIATMIEDVKRGNKRADGELLTYINRLHYVIKDYEIDIESIINRYNRNSKQKTDD